MIGISGFLIWSRTLKELIFNLLVKLDPRFAGSNPAGADGFSQSVKILSMLPSEGK